MYVLYGGFSNFFREYPDLCVGGYKKQGEDPLERARCRQLKESKQAVQSADFYAGLKKSATAHGGMMPPRPFGSQAQMKVAESKMRQKQDRRNKAETQSKLQWPPKPQTRARARSNSDHWSTPTRK